jgi:uncharacterized membrane protein (UPF0136 family)
MQHKALRIITALVASFVALTAIGGGLAILTGLDRFPPEWLEGTPFGDYTIPALLLSIVVGGSALVAAALLFMRRSAGIAAAMLAGAILMGYIAVEVLILKQTPPGPTPVEIFYFVTGALLIGLGLVLRAGEPRPTPAA